MAEVNYRGIALAGAEGGYSELGIKVSEQILPKLFADVAYVKGYMVDGKYEFDAQNAASIIVPTLSRPKGRFRDMKAPSFDPYNPNRDRVNQGHITIEIDREYDEIIDIPEATLVQNMIGNSIVSTMADYVGKIVAENINYITADAMIKASNEYNSELVEGRRKIAYLGANNSVADAFAALKAKIGNADPSKGDTSFNGLPMSAVISNTLEATLLQTKNQFILESSYGQELLIEGTFGRITLGDNVAYRGRIQGINVFALPDGFFPNEYSSELDFTEVPTKGSVLGVIAVPESTYRQFVDRGIKITDSNKFRGFCLQPLYRVGVTVAKPWGIGLLVSEDYVSESLLAEPKTLTWVAGAASKQSKVTTVLGEGETALYKVGEHDVVRGKAYANGTDGWVTLTVNTTNVANLSEGSVVTVAIIKDGKAVAREVHKFTATEIAA